MPPALDGKQKAEALDTENAITNAISIPATSHFFGEPRPNCRNVIVNVLSGDYPGLEGESLISDMCNVVTPEIEVWSTQAIPLLDGYNVPSSPFGTIAPRVERGISSFDAGLGN